VYFKLEKRNSKKRKEKEKKPKETLAAVWPIRPNSRPCVPGRLPAQPPFPGHFSLLSTHSLSFLALHRTTPGIAEAASSRPSAQDRHRPPLPDARPRTRPAWSRPSPCASPRPCAPRTAPRRDTPAHPSMTRHRPRVRALCSDRATRRDSAEPKTRSRAQSRNFTASVSPLREWSFNTSVPFPPINPYDDECL
jgi:hypothetical protein